MNRAISFFHYLSYLQYPLYAIALYYSVLPYLNGIDFLVDNIDILLININRFFIFLGLGISFASLQDTSLTSLKFEQAILKSPVQTKVLLIVLTFSTFAMITLGLVGYFATNYASLNEISLGSLILGIGFLGLLKMHIESIRAHRLKFTE